MIDSSAPADPRAPTRKLSHEVILWAGFGLCLVIAALTVVLPELSGVDARDAVSGASNKKPAPASPASQSR